MVVVVGGLPNTFVSPVKHLFVRRVLPGGRVTLFRFGSVVLFRPTRSDDNVAETHWSVSVIFVRDSTKVEQKNSATTLHVGGERY